MRILAIDLGETTGFALLDGNELLGHDIFPLHHMTEWLAFSIYSHQGQDLTVVERPAYIGPGYEIQNRYSDAISLIRHNYGAEKVKVVRPADWMPRFHSFPLPGTRVLPTQHEKDAFRMAHWALEKFGA